MNSHKIPQPAASSSASGGQSQRSIIEIYTDWANHYLDKLAKKKRISDLRTEVCDGVVLADVIEAVTGTKVPDINRKPKNANQALGNVDKCLKFLSKRGVSVTDVAAKDIQEGNLKAILGLFFQMSRFKQQQKMQQRGQHQGPPSLGEFRSGTPKIPSVPPSPAKSANSSAIPSPMSKKSGNTNANGSPNKSITSRLGGRQVSASALKPPSSATKSSAIPSPSATKTSSMLEKFRLKRSGSSAGPTFTPPPTVPPSHQQPQLPTPTSGPIQYQYQKPPAMPAAPSSSGLGKRTSSSSGFSSARSMCSETSSDSNFPSPSALRRINENESTFSSPQKGKNSEGGSGSSTNSSSSTAPKKPWNGSPSASVRSLSSRGSPKRSPKFARANTEIKDYGPIDRPSLCYPTNRTKMSRIPPPCPSSGGKGSGIPGPKATSTPVKQPTLPSTHAEEATSQKGCTAVKPIQQPRSGRDEAVEAPGDHSEDPMTASFHSKSCSLPRQKRREESSPGPANVAVVSPMPSLKKGMRIDAAAAVASAAAPTTSVKHDQNDDDDCQDEGALKSIVPMAPMLGCKKEFQTKGGIRTSPGAVYGTLVGGPSDYEKGNRTFASLDGGYLSDGDISFAKSHNPLRGHPGSSVVPGDDGYMSESGASLYAKKIQTKIALEKQKTAEEQRAKLEQNQKLTRRPLPGLPDVLGGPAVSENMRSGNSNQVYRVVGGRKHVQKSEAGIQTETASALSKPNDIDQQQKHFDWKQAMAHNARVLSSQEKAMDEYLRRQRAAAEQHIQLANNQLMQQQQQQGFQSMPGTPIEIRRNRNNSSGGGSLERVQKFKTHHENVGYPVSDSEYGRLLATPMANRRSNGYMAPSGSPSSQKRDAVFGSRSLPKGTSSLNYGLMLDRIQQKRRGGSSAKPNINDGSLSDSNYATHSELRFMQPSSTYLHDPYAPWNHGEDLTGSNESLNSVSSSIQQARANSLTKARLMMHQRNTSPKSSFRKTSAISEQSYGSSTTQSNNSEFYGVPSFRLGLQSQEPIHLSRFKSHPTSPSTGTEKSFPGSQSNDTQNNPYSSLPLYKSNNPIYYNCSEAALDGKSDSEIIKLRRELIEEHEKVQNLTSQLATNAHVVAAFEQSLANMTARLHQLTLTSERKDSELNELRRTIAKLRQSGADAGLITHQQAREANELMRQTSTDSMLSAASGDESNPEGSGKRKKSSKHQQSGSTSKRSGWLRSSFTKAFSQNAKNKAGSNASKGGSVSDVEDGSITKMYYEQEQRSQKQYQDQVEQHPRSASAASGSINASNCSNNNNNGPTNTISPEVVSELKRQLMEKDSLLTETRLEALSSAHQLESLRETMNKMRNELINLKSDNEKLQTIMKQQQNRKSLTSSQSSLNGSGTSGEKIGKDESGEDVGDAASRTTEEDEDIGFEKRLSVTMSEISILSGPSSLDFSASTDPANKEGGKLVSVTVSTHFNHNDDDYYDMNNLITIGVISVSGKSKWELLDSLVHRLFKEYVMRVDPTSNLGLNADSIASYDVGEVRRRRDSGNPEYLPYGYLVGEVNTVRINLSGVDALAFETLTPKAIVQRYVSMLSDHRRVILSGPAGTGKTFIAKKLASFVLRSVDGTATPTNSNDKIGSIATFTIETTNVSDLKQFLTRVTDTSNHVSLPKVVVLDNLHHAGNLDEVFNSCLSLGNQDSKCPFIIGTLNQNSTSTAAATNLQLRHNFRWILCASHVEPVRGFLGRFLRQKMLAVETKTRQHDGEMAAIVEWIARAFVRLNRFIESHSSSEMCLSPRVFLDCPVNAKSASRSWFVDVWNETIVPYLVEVVREGRQMYSNKRPNQGSEPVKVMLETWPWSEPPGLNEMGLELLKGLGEHERAELLEMKKKQATKSSLSSSDDPLFNMLVHLQHEEAAVKNKSVESTKST